MLGARSVAVVGASARPDTFGARMIVEAQRSSARMHLVNPRYGRIGDLPCASSLAHLDDPVDLVLLGAPGGGPRAPRPSGPEPAWSPWRAAWAAWSAGGRRPPMRVPAPPSFSARR